MKKSLYALGTVALLLMVSGSASAYHSVFKSSSDSDTCSTSAQCTAYAYHSVSSSPSDCAGVPDNYIGCSVRHYCSNSGSGVAATVYRNCDGASSSCNTAATGGSCGGSHTNTVYVPVNTCVTFTTQTLTVGIGDTAQANPSGLTVCVDHHGPY